MKDTQTLEIDGRFLFYAFMAGGKKVLQNQTEINRINVFPVNDKDTGTNLASTIRSVLDNLQPNKSYKTTIDEIAEAALIGARGNSGVIFAQFLYGVSRETVNKGTISLAEFSESIKNSISYIYEAVSSPIEGTMLTVIRDWSVYLDANNLVFHDFNHLMIESFKILEQSLFETTQKLSILQQYNVVDAGAKGFVLFIEGIIDFIRNGNIRTFVSQPKETISLIHSENTVNEGIKFRYCAEAVLRDVTVGKAEMKELLNQFGDSAVVAGSGTLCRIHIHTNRLAELFNKLKDHGTISFQKVDDMVRQNEAATKKKWNVALVTDSTCDLGQELIDHYQIHMIPFNINFGENQFLDKLTIQPEQFYDLLATSPHFPKTSLINERTFMNCYSHLASHYDAIIAVHLSGQFSGTYANSVKAAEKISREFNKPVIAIDSKSVSGSIGLIVLRVAEAIEEGLSYHEINRKIESWVGSTKIFVTVKTMKYMVKGGRVSKGKGLIANILGIRPIVSVDENGKGVLLGSTFGHKANIRKVMRYIKNLRKENQIRDYIVLHARNHPGAEIYIKKMFRLTGKRPVSVVDISPAIGMNAGIGALAVSLMLE